jgi:hypothetical protein
VGNTQKPNTSECEYKKVVALVIALAKLHNYCIDCDDMVAPSTASDEWQSEVHGAIPLVATTELRSEVHGAIPALVATAELHHDLNRGRTPCQLLDG